MHRPADIIAFVPCTEGKIKPTTCRNFIPQKHDGFMEAYWITWTVRPKSKAINLFHAEFRVLKLPCFVLLVFFVGCLTEFPVSRVCNVREYDARCCWIGDNSEGSGRGLFEILSRHLPGGLRQLHEASVCISSIWTEIRDEYLLDTVLERFV
jgi:hypothetical protein